MAQQVVLVRERIFLSQAKQKKKETEEEILNFNDDKPENWIRLVLVFFSFYQTKCFTQTLEVLNQSSPLAATKNDINNSGNGSPQRS